MNRIPLTLGKSNAVIGWLEGVTATFPVRSRNYYAKAQGYSVDAGTFQDAVNRGAQYIEFMRDDGRRYRLAAAEFAKASELFDWGFGPKMAAPLGLFDRIEAAPLPEVQE